MAKKYHVLFYGSLFIKLHVPNKRSNTVLQLDPKESISFHSKFFRKDPKPADKMHIVVIVVCIIGVFTSFCGFMIVVLLV